jgi:hypothetical protein
MVPLFSELVRENDISIHGMVPLFSPASQGKRYLCPGTGSTVLSGQSGKNDVSIQGMVPQFSKPVKENDSSIQGMVPLFSQASQGKRYIFPRNILTESYFVQRECYTCTF